MHAACFSEKISITLQSYGFLDCPAVFMVYVNMKLIFPLPMCPLFYLWTPACFPSICPLDYIQFDINLELIIKGLKKNMIPKQLKSIAIATIESQFAESEWLHIFTDGFMLH